MPIIIINAMNLKTNQTMSSTDSFAAAYFVSIFLATHLIAFVPAIVVSRRNNHDMHLQNYESLQKAIENNGPVPLKCCYVVDPTPSAST